MMYKQPDRGQHLFNRVIRMDGWMGRDSNSRSPVCETGIITRLDYPSIFLKS